MRNFKSKYPMLGFSIVTGLLTLVFFISLVYAESRSGSANSINWSISVGSLSYNSTFKQTSSYHTRNVTNNGGAISLTYEYMHRVKNNQGGVVVDSTISNTVSVGAGQSSNGSSTRTGDMTNQNPGNYTLHAYTRIEAVRNGQNVLAEKVPADPTPDISISFTR